VDISKSSGGTSGRNSTKGKCGFDWETVSGK
jgi:hypothetical protein